jgi:hypothetical protein
MKQGFILFIGLVLLGGASLSAQETAEKPPREVSSLHFTIVGVEHYHDWRQVKSLIEVLPHMQKMIPLTESFGVAEYRMEIAATPEEIMMALERNFKNHYDFKLNQTAEGIPSLVMRKKHKGSAE